MPCWQRTQSTVKLSGTTDVALLQKALEALGMTVQLRNGTLVFSAKDADAGGIVGTFVNGKLEVRTTSWAPFDENQIKRAYSVQVVQAAAKKYGWVVRAQSETKLTAQRRY